MAKVHARSMPRNTARKLTRRAAPDDATIAELVAIAREPMIRPPGLAELRERVKALRALANVACDQLLLALADPTAPAAVEAAEKGSDFFEGLIESNGVPEWAARVGMWVVDVVWSVRDAAAIQSWAGAVPPRCPLLLGADGKGGRCGMPVAKGAATCWRCAMGRDVTMAVAS